MEKYHIRLTAEEIVLVHGIRFRVSRLDDVQAIYKANKEPVLALVKSLYQRQAIPEKRLRYWDDPDYNTGRLKGSHKDVFEKNGCVGQQTYAHLHFLPYLQYFLFGPDLPDGVIAAFEGEVGDPEWITSGDIIPMCRCAGDLTRQHRLDRAHASEEFFKLCIEIGLQLHVASDVRRSVRQMR